MHRSSLDDRCNPNPAVLPDKEILLHKPPMITIQDIILEELHRIQVALGIRIPASRCR